MLGNADVGEEAKMEETRTRSEDKSTTTNEAKRRLFGGFRARLDRNESKVLVPDEMSSNTAHSRLALSQS